jgi:hypothetical protein
MRNFAALNFSQRFYSFAIEEILAALETVTMGR